MKFHGIIMTEVIISYLEFITERRLLGQWCWIGIHVEDDLQWWRCMCSN